MAKRAASFDRTAWDTGVSPVARSKAERCSVCNRGTGKRSYWVEERVMCEGCAGKSITGAVPHTSISAARTMLYGIATMVAITIVYVLMHLAKN